MSVEHSKVMRANVILIGLAGVLALAGCDNKELTEKPERSSQTPTFETVPSTVGALASIQIEQIKQLVNDKVPKSFDSGGFGEDVCERVLGVKVCAGTRYDLHAERSGDIGIAGIAPSTIRVTLPVKFSGNGGLRGDGAKILKLDKKNFKGGIVVRVDLTPEMGEDWCPHVGTGVSYDWTTDPKVEIVGGVWVSVKSKVEDEINKKIPELAEAAKNAIDCAQVRDKIAAIYGSKTFPVDVPNAGQVHVNVEPTDIAFSGLNVSAESVKAAALITAKLEVSQTPLTPQNLPLPPLKKIEAVPPHIQLAVPLRASYDTLTQALSKEVVDQTFEQETPAGKIVLVGKGVEVYPSDGRVVIGLTFDADLPTSWFDTKGTVYLLARPTVEGGTRVVLDDMDYAQVLDNEFWSTAAVLFEGPILNQLKANSTYDLTTQIATAKDALAAKLNDPASTPGWKVTLSDVDIKVGRIATAEKELEIEGLFGANASVEPTAP